MTNNNFSYEITTANSSDIEVIAQFQLDMAMESESLVLDKSIVLRGVSAVVNDPSKGKYIVARYNGQAIGSLMLTMEWSDWNDSWYWWIQSVYVAPEHRRRGVFSAMYQSLEKLAKQDNVNQIRLYVDRANLRAQNTYQKLGMHESHYLMYEKEF